MKKILYLLILTFALTIGNIFADVKNISNGTIYSTVTNAVQAATPGDTLLVSTGVYYEAVNIYNQDLLIDGKYNDEFSAKIPDGKTIISAPHEIIWYSGSVFDITNSTVTLINIEITEGGFGIAVSGSGGGIDIRHGSDVTLFSCLVYTNFCRGNGGGIYVYDSTLFTTNTLVFGNNAYAGSYVFGDNGCGGGIYANNSQVDLYSFSKIYNNMARSQGGGLRLKNSEATLVVSYVFDNSADEGGGVAADSSSYRQLAASGINNNLASSKGGGILLENNSTGTVSGFRVYVGYAHAEDGPNIVTNGNGGGVYVADSVFILTNEAGIAHNIASGSGGGIFATNGFLVVTHAEIGIIHDAFTNSAEYGGGIFARESSLNITNSVIAHGYADEGGGIVLANCSTVIENSKIVKNYAINGMGGGILMGGTNIFYASQSSFNNNFASASGGGVTLITELGNVNFESCSIISNVAGSAGGLLSHFGSSATISGASVINHNIAKNVGGGLASFYFSAIHLKNDGMAPLVIQGNIATNHGGGIYGDYFASISAEGNILIGNNISLQNGGGIYLTNNCSLSTTNSGYFSPRVFANSAEGSGGGIFIAGSNSVANLYRAVIGGENIGNVCNDNYGSANGGGGIAIRESATVNAINCVFEDNSSLNSGGGIYLGTNGTLNMSCNNETQHKSYLYNNSAKNAGGGIFAKSANELTIENTTVVSNKTQNGAGGGVYINQTSNKLVNLVIAQNDGGFPSGADGIFFYKCPKSEMLQCTIADNDRIGVMNNSGGPVNMANCIAYGHSVSQIWPNAEINTIFSDVQNGYPGVGNIDANPLFTDITNFNYRIVVGSPCEDFGMNLPSVTNDLDGTFRPQGSGWDMGAFEVIPEPGIFLILNFGFLILFIIKRRGLSV